MERTPCQIIGLTSNQVGKTFNNNSTLCGTLTLKRFIRSREKQSIAPNKEEAL